MDFVQELVGCRIVMRRPVFGAGSWHEETHSASLASYEDFTSLRLGRLLMMLGVVSSEIQNSSKFGFFGLSALE
jgi:hypothetical protein